MRREHENTPSALTHGRRRSLGTTTRTGEPMRHSLMLLAAASATALILSGCARNEAAEPKAAPLPQESVAPVISRKATEFDELTGRFEPGERGRIPPPVHGYVPSRT